MGSQPKQTKDPKVDERQINYPFFIDEKMKLEREKVSRTQLTPVNSVTPIGFESSLKDLSLKHHIHFSGNQETSKIPVVTLAFIVIFRRQNHRITESQNSRGWKGPLWVI